MFRIALEFVKIGGNGVISLLVRLIDVCVAQGEVREDWRSSCIVPSKGMGAITNCLSYRGTSLLSIQYLVRCASHD